GLGLLSLEFDWPMFRGAANRTAQGVGSTAYLEPRWTAWMHPREDWDTSDPKDGQTISVMKAHVTLALERMEGKPILPTFFPVAGNGRLIGRNYEGVWAYSLKDEETPNGKVRAGQILWGHQAKNGLHSLFYDAGKRQAIEQWYNTYYSASSIGPLGVFFE